MSDLNEESTDVSGCQRKDTIKNGSFVIIQRTHDEEASLLVKVEANKTVYLRKQRLCLTGIIGHEFGCVFEIDKNHQVKLIDQEQVNNRLVEVVPEDDNEMRDNRFVNDDGKSQLLSKDDIELMKSEVSGTEIIEHLVKNSTTFKDKTSFSQEKYLKKKQKKYSSLVNVIKPNIRLLAQMYYAQGPGKLNFLRFDSLAQMLTLCNVRSNSNYLVLDSHLGLVTAAVLDRLGSAGTVIQVYTDPGPVASYRQAVDALNLPKDLIEKLLIGIQIDQVFALTKETVKPEASDDCLEPEAEDEKAMRKKQRRVELARAKEMLRHNNLDGLLMLTRQFDPLNILLLLFDFLSPSRPFVVFSPTVEPLLPCFEALKNRAAHMNITSTWLRRMQVMPDRTRPDMLMSGSSGFLFSGIKVIARS